MYLKVKRPQRHIFKIESKRFRRNGWRLNIETEEALNNNEIVQVGESQIFRMIDLVKFSNSDKTYDDYNKIKEEINEIKKEESNYKTKNRMKNLVDLLFKCQFEEDYIMVKFNTKKDYKKMVNDGFKLNGKNFLRLYGTTVGIKNNTVIFVSENIHEKIYNMVENGRDKDIEIVPAKYEAYRSLTSSVSVPLSYVRPDQILVVEDHVTNFKSDATNVNPTVKDDTHIEFIKDMEMELEASDGNGIISPRLSKEFAMSAGHDYIPTGFCIRNSFLKGMVFTFPIDEFIGEIAIGKHSKSPIVKDVWGNDVDVRNIEMIIPVSVFKLWYAYDSIHDYIDKCNKNGYGFSATKVLPEELENERSMNYQFLQSLYLTDEDIDELIQPTINEFKDVLKSDYRKTILYLKGKDMNESSFYENNFDFTKALMIDKNIINDPFVSSNVYKMLKKSINEAKVGVVKVRGNYSTVSGDMFGFMEHVFNIEVDGKRGKGLLCEDEFYADYWNRLKIDKVVSMRAPMCTHANIRILRLKNESRVNKWFRYMKSCTVFNSWDSARESLSGADADGDSILSTDNDVIIKGVKELPPIICSLDNVDKSKIDEKKLILSNLNGFNNNVGAVTNKATNIRNKMCNFHEDSDEYKELFKREMSIQRIQQSVIDSIKTGKSEKIPKSWVNYKSNKVSDEDDEKTVNDKKFNLKILADKKPYFMIYIYEDLNRKYKNYIKRSNRYSIMRFDMSLDELLSLPTKNKEQREFVKWHDRRNPVDMSPSVINKICKRFEDEFDKIISEIRSESDFDYRILKSDFKYKKGNYEKIKRQYARYKEQSQEMLLKKKIGDMDEDSYKSIRSVKLKFLISSIFSTCTNAEEICNIVLDLCYNSDSSKQFAWDSSGEQIIKNLLHKNNNEFKYYIQDLDGDIEFGGDRFKEKTGKVGDDV